MKKIKTFLVIFIFSIVVFTPINSYAISLNNSDNQSFVVHRLDNKITNSNQLNGLNDGYDQEQDCSGLLGDPNDENSVAWLLQQLLNYIKVLGPILVVVLSSIDFTLRIVNSDDDWMAKAKKKLGQRLILAALLFFVPTISMALLDIFGITADPTCGIG